MRQTFAQKRMPLGYRLRPAPPVCSAPAILSSRPAQRQSRHRDDTVRPPASFAFGFAHPTTPSFGNASLAAASAARAFALSSSIWRTSASMPSNFTSSRMKAIEGDIQRRAIEVALEIEQEHFQQRRAMSKVGRRPKLTTPSRRSHSRGWTRTAYAGVLEPAILVEPDIGGRIAEIATAFLAIDHGAGHEPRAAAASWWRRRSAPPPAPSGSRWRTPAAHRYRYGPGRRPRCRSRGASLTSKLGEPHAPLAEMKIVADRDPYTEPPDQVMVNEILRGGPRAPARVEGHHHGAGKPVSRPAAAICWPRR